MDMNELPEDLQERLKAYQEHWSAMDSLKAQGEGERDPEVAAGLAKDALGVMVVDAVIVAHDLMMNANSETEKGRMARYVIDAVIKDGGAAIPGNPLEDMFKKLTEQAEVEVNG